MRRLRTFVAQTVTIGEQKVSQESESLKFSATPTPQVQNPSDSDSTALLFIDPLVYLTSGVDIDHFENHFSNAKIPEAEVRKEKVVP